MKIIHKKSIIREELKPLNSIGFVPTMGFLHKGHETLIKKAREENDFVVVSIFVNPIQFNNSNDLENYPSNLKRDKEICEDLGVDFLFAPQKEEMYNGRKTTISISDLGNNLCGRTRPGHFDGVCTVLSKLFNIIDPTRAYFGQKDAQQLSIVEKMVNDLDFPIEIIGVPTVRENDGLAMSSRNSNLSKEERIAASIIPKSLEIAKKRLSEGELNASKIISMITNEIQKEPLSKIDYIEVVDFENLQTIEYVDNKILVALAVFFGNTRLIDNFVFDSNP